jgi:uncharacterized protein YgbK (DUF1537 family)
VTHAIQIGIQRGLETIVLLPEAPVPEPPPAVLVIDTESRGTERGEARARLLYKKIDSTLRGPVAAEVAGALEGAGLPAVLLTGLSRSMARPRP